MSRKERATGNISCVLTSFIYVPAAQSASFLRGNEVLQYIPPVMGTTGQKRLIVHHWFTGGYPAAHDGATNGLKESSDLDLPLRLSLSLSLYLTMDGSHPRFHWLLIPSRTSSFTQTSIMATSSAILSETSFIMPSSVSSSRVLNLPTNLSDSFLSLSDNYLLHAWRRRSRNSLVFLPRGQQSIIDLRVFLINSGWVVTGGA